MSDKLLAVFLKVRRTIFRYTPQLIVYGLGGLIGLGLYLVMASRRRVAQENVTESLKLGPRDSSRLTRACFIQLGVTVAEIIFIPKVTPKFLTKNVEIDGVEHLKSAWEQRKGVIVFSGHFGNWELMGGVLTALGFPLSAAAKKQRSPLGHELLSAVRSEYGIKAVGNKMGLRAAYSALHRGEVVALLGDQKARNQEWIIDFFERPAAAFPGPVLLAQRTGAPIVPVYLARIGVGQHRLIVLPQVSVSKEASPEELAEILQQLNETLERVIRDYLPQWFWIHRRWQLTGEIANAVNKQYLDN